MTADTVLVYCTVKVWRKVFDLAGWKCV